MPMDGAQTQLLSLDTDRMIAEKDGAIGWITFNNPARRNAVSLDMWQAIPGIVAAFQADAEIRTIVLKGAGDKAFVAGADISQFEQQRASADDVDAYERITDQANDSLATCAKPTVAMINGFCIGGGLAIALSCDLRIAADNARFGIPAAKLGLGYRHGGIKKLLDLVGPAYAKEIFYTARHFNGEEARHMGLINHLVAVDALEAETRALCETIGENAPMTIAAVKRTIRELSRLDGNGDYALCDRLVQECFASEDYIEGRRAFMEKRKPVFKGR